VGDWHETLPQDYPRHCSLKKDSCDSDGSSTQMRRVSISTVRRRPDLTMNSVSSSTPAGMQRFACRSRGRSRSHGWTPRACHVTFNWIEIPSSEHWSCGTASRGLRCRTFITRRANRRRSRVCSHSAILLTRSVISSQSNGNIVAVSRADTSWPLTFPETRFRSHVVFWRRVLGPV
jgi:hypothetical protein